MVERQFEISRSAFIFKCGAAILFGSMIPAWVFIIWNYFFTIKEHGYYSAPISILEMQLACLPIFTYQIPAYFFSGMTGMSLLKRRLIKSALTAYLGIGVAGWIISTLLLFVMDIGLDDSLIQTMEFAIVQGLPTLLLYLLFLYPRYTKQAQLM